MRAPAGFIVGLLAMTLAPAIAQAKQAPSTGAKSRVDRPVVFVSPGAISLGAYQGGVDWTILDFLRRQREAELPPSLGTLQWKLDLKAAAGASAGNIDALIAALTWCAADLDKSAEDSLFWNVWMRTGIGQLMPDRIETSELAVFDRQFFYDVHLPSLQAFASKKPWHTDCRVPLGLTVTAQVPVAIHLPEGGDGIREAVQVQRMATVLAVRANGPRLAFEALDLNEGALTRPKSLGALLVPPQSSRLSAGCSTNDFFATDPLKWVFNVVLASSSFPVAFAPRTICYQNGGLLLDRTTPHDLESGQFFDGGVFDNNPMGLALGLSELGRGHTPIDVIYTDPSKQRGAEQVAQVEREEIGLSAVAQLLSGAVGAGRQYEVQAFLRQNQRDSLLTTKEAPTIRLSSRHSPVVGEMLGSFAGFLGRPFREYDFYSGVYDGIELVAEQYLCGPREIQCVEEKVAGIITSDLFPLNRFGQCVVRWRWAMESSNAIILPGCTPDNLEQARGASASDQRLALLRAIHEQLAAKVAKARKRQRASQVPVASPSIADELSEFLLGLSKTPNIGGITAALMTEECKPDVRKVGLKDREARSDCFVDPDFASLVNDPDEFLLNTMRRVMRTLEEVEGQVLEKNRSEKCSQCKELTAQIEFLSLAFQSKVMHRRTGLSVNPSSGIWDCAFRSELKDTPTTSWRKRCLGTSLLARVVPNYVNFGLAGPANTHPMVALGWRPLALSRNLFSLTGLFELTKYEDLPLTWTSSLSLGGMVNVSPRPRSLLSSVGVGAVSSKRFKDGPLPDGREWVLRAVWRALYEKVQFGLEKSSTRWAVTVGFSDINGLAYWLFR